MRSVVLAILAVSISNPFAHSGGLDSQGGHTDKTTGQYHCHKCKATPQEQSQKALEEAKREGRAFDLVYDRADWPHWIDEDGDCQDARTEVLAKTSQAYVLYKNRDNCVAVVGLWIDPYSGKKWTLARDLDIDHVVPLQFAHNHGAANWPESRKKTFANDLDNLIPVEASLNRSKGAKGPTEWMPPLQSYRCEYLSRFDGIMAKYELEYTSSELRVVKRMREACE